MQIKYCPDCSTENMIAAKFCMGCRFEFPQGLTINSSTRPNPVVPAPKTQPKVMQLEYELTDNPEDTHLEDDEPSGRALPPGGEVLANSFIQILESSGKLNPRAQGTKLGDVIGTSKVKAPRRKADKSLPKDGMRILESTKYKRGEGQE